MCLTPDIWTLSKFVVAHGIKQTCAEGTGIALRSHFKVHTIQDGKRIANREVNLTCTKPKFGAEGGCAAQCFPTMQFLTNKVPTFCTINCIKGIRKMFSGGYFTIWCHLQKQLLCPLERMFKAGTKCMVNKRADLFSVTLENKVESAKVMSKAEALKVFGKKPKGSEKRQKDATQYDETYGLCRDALLPN